VIQPKLSLSCCSSTLARAPAGMHTSVSALPTRRSGVFFRALTPVGPSLPCKGAACSGQRKP